MKWVLKQNPKNRKIEDYFSIKETRFFSLLKSTSKWKELYNQSESKTSIVLTIAFIVFIYFIYENTQFLKFIDLILELLKIVIGASTGMLGFIISGLAIFTGTITNRLVKSIDSEDKAEGIVGILFSFYFIGAVIAISVFLSIISFVLLWADMLFNIHIFMLLAVIVSYLFVFSILYSVSLLGTCIRLFLISYKYSKKNNEE